MIMTQHFPDSDCMSYAIGGECSMVFVYCIYWLVISSGCSYVRELLTSRVRGKESSIGILRKDMLKMSLLIGKILKLFRVLESLIINVSIINLVFEYKNTLM